MTFNKNLISFCQSCHSSPLLPQEAVVLLELVKPMQLRSHVVHADPPEGLHITPFTTGFMTSSCDFLVVQLFAYFVVGN